MTCKLTHL